ncbi:MAG: hypothetical protein DRH04_02825 [Deltaproteobacteria bacterium]|nr:MAG: hypothetical protein DRH04_02825 [Deltaproteobacteria bacterium]
MKKFMVLMVLVASLALVGTAFAGEDVQKAAEDITKAGYCGPGSINVHRPGDIQMSFGATMRIIPTMEDNFDFGLSDENGFAGGDVFQSHANESGWVNNSYIRCENKLYFNAMPNDQVWSFYAALEFDGVLDNMTVDDRGNNDPGKSDNKSSNSNYGLERLHGTVKLPFGKSMNLRLHAGWDIYQLDVYDGGGLVFGDDDPGFWITGDFSENVKFQIGYHKLKENDWQISDIGPDTDYDDDRDLYSVAVDYHFDKKSHVKFFYAYDRIRNIAANTLQSYLFGKTINDTLDSSQNDLSTAVYNNPSLGPAFVTGGTIVGTDLATNYTLIEGGTVNTAIPGYGAAQLQINGGRASLASNYFYGNETKADTDSHHIGFYYQGDFGIVKPFVEAVYQFGQADNTGLSAYGYEEDYDIKAYALAADLTFNLKDAIGFKFEPHIGIIYTSGDDDPDDDDLEGYTGVDNCQRFSAHWGGENTIIGDTNLLMGSVLYGYLPELYGSGTPVTTGGLQNFAGAGGGRGDNPGLLMYSIGLNMAPKRFLLFRSNVNIFNFNEDFRLPTLSGTVVEIDNGYAGTEWDNEVTLALSKNMFIKGQFSFLFPGEVIEDVTEAYSGEECDDVATRLGIELIWNF